nr:ParB N-terminal domain-containing protein [uncultured Brevundimonas sp.]
MLELNILAVQNADILRALASPADRRAVPSLTALAAAIGRDKSNLSKTLKILEGAGLLLAEPIANGLTSDGLLQLEAINRAETASAGGDAMPDGLLALRHDQILPDPDNARQDWTSDDAKDELDALRADIVKNGLLQNLVVRPMAADDLQDATITVVTPAGEQTLPRYRLVAGERRWRAIRAMIPVQPPGKGLIVLRNALITEELARRGVEIETRAARRPMTWGAYSDGLRAGDGVALNPGVAAASAARALR